MDEEKDRLIEEIGVIKRGIRTVSYALRDIVARMSEIEEKLERQKELMNPVLKSIKDDDAKGINKTLFECNNIYGKDNVQTLLEKGEIFEINSKVYPLDSVNLKGDTVEQKES